MASGFCTSRSLDGQTCCLSLRPRPSPRRPLPYRPTRTTDPPKRTAIHGFVAHGRKTNTRAASSPSPLLKRQLAPPLLISLLPVSLLPATSLPAPPALPTCLPPPVHREPVLSTRRDGLRIPHPARVCLRRDNHPITPSTSRILTPPSARLPWTNTAITLPQPLPAHHAALGDQAHRPALSPRGRPELGCRHARLDCHALP